MPDVAQVLKAEIRRIARSEIRTTVAALNTQIQTLKKTVRQQREQLAVLEKGFKQTARTVTRAAVVDADRVEAPARRMSAASIRRHRLRLQLSQRELGQLIGVSTNTIVRWEQGVSAPQDRHKRSLGQLRREGVRSIRAQLAS